MKMNEKSTLTQGLRALAVGESKTIMSYESKPAYVALACTRLTAEGRKYTCSTKGYFDRSIVTRVR